MKCDELKDYDYDPDFPFQSRGRFYVADEVDAAIAELKQKLEDAGMRERRLRRALWIARAELCRRLDVDRYLRKHINSWYNENCLTWAEACVAMEVKMCKAESKCRAKAEEYK